MAFKIKDLMINIGSRTGSLGGRSIGCSGAYCRAAEAADAACVGSEKSDGQEVLAKADVCSCAGKHSDVNAGFGCPGRHTDVACPGGVTFGEGCTNHRSDGDCTNHRTDGDCTNHRTDGDCTNHRTDGDCTNHRTDGEGCPGRHTDIVIGIKRETDIGICVGTRTLIAQAQPRRAAVCPGRHTDPGAWKANPEGALDELNAIKAQLTAELAKVDDEIREIEDGLQTKLQEALDELGKMKADFEKK